MAVHTEEQQRQHPLHPQHHHHRPLQALVRFVHLSTFIVPTQHGHHRLPLVTTADEKTAEKKYPHTRFVSLSEATQKHLRVLFVGLCGLSLYLSRERFAEFLEKTQGEVVVPLEKEKYKFEEFLEVWSFQYHWDALQPAQPMSERDMSRSLANYFISSSHNTYLLGNQLSSESSAKVYGDVRLAPQA
jgi:phosphatidylinositol phospholipase C, delta